MADADPRLRPECVERCCGGDVVLVGVLHDHPASVYRVRTLAERIDPPVLALELPPLAVPLYDQYASDERTPPSLGGEMSAAIQAADADRVVGIDGPTPGFLRHVATGLYRADASAETVRKTAEAVCSVTKSALSCRVAAAATALTPFQVAVDTPTAYDTARGDDAHRQADDERSCIDQANSMLSAFGTPPAAAVRTTARERYMADRLGALRSAGPVIAVVGMAHLEAVASRLDD